MADAAGHADPRTTQRYNRRRMLDEHPAYALASQMAARLQPEDPAVDARRIQIDAEDLKVGDIIFDPTRRGTDGRYGSGVAVLELRHVHHARGLEIHVNPGAEDQQLGFAGQRVTFAAR